jgi:hypothetical protein
MFFSPGSPVSSTNKKITLYIYRFRVGESYGMPLSAILWQSVLLVEETGEPGEKNTDLSQVFVYRNLKQYLKLSNLT